MVGRLKNSIALAALRSIQLKIFSRHTGMPGLSPGSSVWRLRKKLVSIILNAWPQPVTFLSAAGTSGAFRIRNPADRCGLVRSLTRLPSARELSRLTALHQSLRADYESDPEAAKQLLASAGLKEGDAAMVGVANVLLNLDETLTKP